MTLARTPLIAAVLLAALALTVGVAAEAQPAAEGDAEQPKELTVKQIVDRANHAAYYQGDDGKARVKMTIYDSAEDKAAGRSRSRQFVILRKDVADGGDQFFYLYFQDPPDVRKMVYRVWKHVGKDDDRWLYTPALDLVNRVAASDERTSFVGSHFYYEDVSGRGTEEDTHELLQDETNDQFYVLKSTPRKPGEVEFAWYKTYIDRKTFLPLKSIFYKPGDTPYRIIQALKRETIEGFPTVVRSQAVELKIVDGKAVPAGETINEFTKVDYNVGLDEDIFKQERYLRRPPRAARD